MTNEFLFYLGMYLLGMFLFSVYLRIAEGGEIYWRDEAFVCALIILWPLCVLFIFVNAIFIKVPNYLVTKFFKWKGPNP